MRTIAAYFRERFPPAVFGPVFTLVSVAAFWSVANTTLPVTTDTFLPFLLVRHLESLELPASLASMLRFPLCGERRVAYCHVRDSSLFMEEAKSWLKDRGDVMPSAQLVEDGWFGPGTPHPRLDERIGDVALVMHGRYTVKDWAPGESRHLHIGNHGGTSEDEMLIPLIVEKT